MTNNEEILEDNPSTPGWYVVCVTIPEDSGEIEAGFWDGKEWSWERESSIYKVVWAYARRFESEADAENWIALNESR